MNEYSKGDTEGGRGGGMIGEKMRKMHQSANIHMLEKHMNMTVLLTNFFSLMRLFYSNVKKGIKITCYI